ncbi:glycosyltransferase family 2 protein [Haliea sp.]
MTSESFVSIVIPARDEAENIAGVIHEIHSVLRDYRHYEIVVVDDGSRDQTLTVASNTAEALGCAFKGVAHRHSIGQSGALRSGVNVARGALVITMDGDGQNDPADIPLLLQQAAMINNPDYCIAGFRFARQDSAWKRFQSRLANRVRNALLHDGVPDTGCGLKLLPKATFLKLPWFDHIHRFIPALVRGIGGEIRVVRVGHRPRRAGISKYSAWNRAWVGIVDLFGVRWLLARTPNPDFITDDNREYSSHGQVGPTPVFPGYCQRGSSRGETRLAGYAGEPDGLSAPSP